MLLSMQEGSCGNWKTKMKNIDNMNIDDLYNMDEVTILFGSDPLTGHYKGEAEAEPENEDFSKDYDILNVSIDEYMNN